MLKVRLRRSADVAGATVVPVFEGAAVPSEVREAAQAAGFVGKAGEACEVFAPSGRMLLVGAARGGGCA